MEKKEKLGKLGNTLDDRELSYLIREINSIIEKQGEIIDHLNSQDQPEEATGIAGRTNKEEVGIAGSTDAVWDSEKGEYIRKKQDTPEEKKEKFKQTLPEGLKRYYTKEAGEWGSIIDSLTSEDKAKLALSLMYGEPLYTQRELDKAREEGYEKGYKEGQKFGEEVQYHSDYMQMVNDD